MAHRIITNSSITQFKRCRKEFYHRNVRQLVSRFEGEARGIGTAVHKGLETGSTDDAMKCFDDIFASSQEEADKLEVQKATVTAMLDGYFSLYGKQFDGQFWPEKRFNVPIINPATGAASRRFRLAGKADGLLLNDTGYWLVEYKTTGVMDKTYVDRLSLDAQMTTYLCGLQRQDNISIEGVIYRIIRKPTIRQRQKETILQFTARLTADYKSRPDFYFYEERLYRSKEDLHEFERELWDIAQDMGECHKQGRWYRDTTRCGTFGRCDYMDLCLRKSDAEQLFVEKVNNSELEV